MCGRYVIFTSEEYKEMRSILKEIEKYFKSGIGISDSMEMYPGTMVPTIKNIDGKIHYGVSKWGLPLYNSKKLIINARAEGINEKRMFKNLMPLIFPANGYYEWHDKIKYFIKPTTLQTMYFAGLFDRKNNAAIITTNASKKIAPIHDRMPVILNKDNAKKWMSQKDTSLLISYLTMMYTKVK